MPPPTNALEGTLAEISASRVSVNSKIRDVESMANLI